MSNQSMMEITIRVPMNPDQTGETTPMVADSVENLTMELPPPAVETLGVPGFDPAAPDGLELPPPDTALLESWSHVDSAELPPPDVETLTSSKPKKSR